MNIKTISKLAGVSPTTVSFVLNNKKGISEETRQKVLRVIEEEKYIPNINSRRLSMKRSFNVAFITNEAFAMFSDVFATRAMKAAVDKASSLGYSILLLPATGENGNDHLISEIKQGNVDGAVVFHDVDKALHRSIVSRGIPLVVIDSLLANPPYSSIVVDYELAAYTAVNYLIEKGHRKIAYLGLETLPDHYLACLRGYKKAMQESSLPIEPHWMGDAVTTELVAGEIARKMLKTENRPTAIFCGNDLTAIGAIRGVVGMGLQVPRDVSFISIDDIFISEYYNPSLTTLRLDMTEMGNKSIEILDDLINGKTEIEIYKVRSDMLIERESVRDIR